MKLSQLTGSRQEAAAIITEVVVAAKHAICAPKNTAKGEAATPDELSRKLYEEAGEVIDAKNRTDAVREAGDLLWTCALYVWSRWGVKPKAGDEVDS